MMSSDEIGHFRTAACGNYASTRSYGTQPARQLHTSQGQRHTVTLNLLTEVLWKIGSILAVESASQLVEIQKNQLWG
jgi:hypothetical protein